MTAQELFERLTNNAIDFALHGIDEFERSPKYSVIDFYAAVELFLKARLLREHWSLVVAKEPDRTRFESGDFQSVTFEEACKRLANIVGSAVPDAAKKTFDNVRRHRNKMVHFFHGNDQQTTETIVSEQLSAWYYLHSLLTTQWLEVFEAYADQLAEVENRLRGHREYLRAKFDGLKDTIAKRIEDGFRFVFCTSCGFESAQVEDVLGSLQRYDCLVCGVRREAFDWECPQCGQSTLQSDASTFQCDNCGHEENEKELVESLNQEERRPDEAILCLTPANCADCESYQTVIEYEGKYLCVSCFAVSDGLEQCGWCSEYNNGDMEYSYMSGCSVCEGHAGWHADD